MDETVTVLQITDTHLFADNEKTLLGVNTQESLDAVIKMIVTDGESPDIVLLTGDLSQDDSEQSYQKLVLAMQAFQCPVYWIPGNHDTLAPLQKIFSEGQLRSEKWIDLPHWQIILLDTLQEGKVAGVLLDDQLQHLRDCLEKTDKHVMICLHHHAIPIHSEWLDKIGLTNNDEFFGIVDTYSHVRIVLCGHVHQEFVETRQNVTYIASPSTCVQFKPHSARFAVEDKAPGCRYLYLKSNGTMTTKIKRLVNFSAKIDFDEVGY